MSDHTSGNVQLKSPTGPWWVINGTPGEIVQQIGQVFPHLVQNPQATDFPVIVAQAAAEWAQLVSATSQTPAQQPAQTFQAGAQQPQGFAQPSQHAQAVNTVQNAVQGTVQGGGTIETNKWGAQYEWNAPGAPQTMHGLKVKKTATSQKGSQYTAWIDPRSPEIPSVYKANGKEKPADLLEPEFFRA